MWSILEKPQWAAENMFCIFRVEYYVTVYEVHLICHLLNVSLFTVKMACLLVKMGDVIHMVMLGLIYVLISSHVCFIRLDAPMFSECA